MTVANSSCRPGRGAALAQSEAGILERFEYTEGLVEIEEDGAWYRIVGGHFEESARKV